MPRAREAGAKLWDWPVRLIHWSFVALMPMLWWTAQHDNISLHKRLGLVMLGLVVARLMWGVVGSEPARFARFVKGPRGLMAYLRGREKAAAGHNPLGALSVLALLGLLLAEVVLGLVTQDVDGIESGPLNYLVSFDVAEAARHLHELVFNLLLGLIALHLCAILYYRLFKRDNLLTPMVFGRKALDEGMAAPAMAPAWRALACAVVAAALAWWLGAGAPH